MKLVKISIDRPITVLMLYILFILVGVISFYKLSVDFLPDIGYPRLSIITNCENMTAEEVETLVTEPIEEISATLKGIKNVSSASRENLSIVNLSYNWGENMSFAALHLREKLDNLRYLLPDDANRPNIAKLDPSDEPILYICVSNLKNKSITEVQDIAENLIKNRLQQIEGVAAAEIIGNLEKEIQITLNPQLIKTLGLSITDISTKIANSNFVIAGGSIIEGQYKHSLRIVGEFTTIEDIALTPIKLNENGSIIRLKQVAEIKSGFDEDKAKARFNLNPSIGLLIRKEAGANTPKVCGLVKQNLEILQKEYPNVKFDIALDQSVFIEDSIKSVLEAIIIGALLAFLVLFLFLNDYKSPIQISIVIPIAILICFALMYFRQISLNIISLSGLALGVGMLVDNSIVVYESIFRYKQNHSWKRAAYLGTKEVGLAITASTLTTLAVFLPILYVSGVAASLFKQQALTVSFSLLSSLFVSLTALPLLASLRQSKTNQSKKSWFIKVLAFPFIILLPLKWLFGAFIKSFQKGFSVFAKTYEALLKKCLNNKVLTLAIFAVVFVFAVLLSLTFDREFFPDFEQNEFTISIKSQPGTPIEKTDKIVGYIEQVLNNDKRITSIFTTVGKSTDDMLAYYLDDTVEDNLAQIKVKTNYSSKKLITEYAQKLKKFPVELSFKKGDNLLSSLLELKNTGLAIAIEGTDIDLMKKRALAIKKQLEDEEDFYLIKTDFELTRPSLRLKINRKNAALYNVDISQIAKFIRSSVTGLKVSSFKRFDKRDDIILSLGKTNTYADLIDSEMVVNGNRVPLRLLVDTTFEQKLNEINRVNQSRRFTISFNYKGKLKNALNKLQILKQKNTLNHEDLKIKIEGINDEIDKSLSSLAWALAFAVLLVYMILASQFESFILPLIVMFTAPMGLIGVSLALYISGVGISIMSTLGMIVLSGIIVNDAILLVDLANKLQKTEKLGVFAAVTMAAKTRLRPILMTTLTTVLGLLPLALGIGSSAELQSAMAIAVIGGMLAATFLTLILIPVLYSLLKKGKLHEN